MSSSITYFGKENSLRSNVANWKACRNSTNKAIVFSLWNFTNLVKQRKSNPLLHDLFNDLLFHGDPETKGRIQWYTPKIAGAQTQDSGTDGSKAFIHHSLCSVSYRKSLSSACVRVSTSVDLDDTIHQVEEPTSYRSEQLCFSICIYRWNVGVCPWWVHKSREWAVLLDYSRGVMRFICSERRRERFYS